MEQETDTLDMIVQLLSLFTLKGFSISAESDAPQLVSNQHSLATGTEFLFKWGIFAWE
jgi:hypothetical protein